MSYTSLLIDTCTIIHRELDKWGALVSQWSEPGVKCRIEWHTQLVRDMRGEQTISTATVYFLTSASIEHNDRLFFDEREWSIIQFKREKDSTKLHHKEVMV